MLFAVLGCCAFLAVAPFASCADETGAIRAQARSPWGTTFLAAERGLFVTSEDRTRPDPLALDASAPRGMPLGVVADRGERVWLLTEREFGPVDPRRGFGRVLGLRDGVPPGPYRGLALGADGTLVIALEEGEHRYRPDQGPAPNASIRSWSWNGAVLEVELAEPRDESTSLTFRWRRADELEWLTLDSPSARIADLEPGRRVLAFAAWDRDLRVSPIAWLEVDVPRPRERVWLPLGALAVTAALALGLAARARPGARLRATFAPLVVGLIAAQLVAALSSSDRGWPFVGFAMYSRAALARSLADHGVLSGLDAAGGERVLRLTAPAAERREVLRALLAALDGGEREREQCLGLLRVRAPDLVGYRLRLERSRLTEGGAVAVAPLELVQHVSAVHAPR